MNKRIMAMTMAVLLLITCVPQTAYATDTAANESVTTFDDTATTEDATDSADVTSDVGGDPVEEQSSLENNENNNPIGNNETVEAVGNGAPSISVSDVSFGFHLNKTEEERTKINVYDLSYEKEGYPLYLISSTGDVYSISSKKDLHDNFGINEADVTADNFKVEVLKKSGDSYVAASAEECPIEFSVGSEETNNMTLYINKKENYSNAVQCFFRVTLNFDFIVSSKRTITLPIIANPEPEVICNTKAEAYQAVRDILRNRTNNMSMYSDASNYANYDTNGYVYERIYVKSDLFASGTIPLFDTFDFESERDGMKPYEGDYMRNLIGNRLQREFRYDAPGKVDQNGEPYGYKNINGASYDIYEVYLPVITIKEEEDAVDAKVAEILATPEFKAVANGTNKEKIQVIYNYITTHVSGTVSGDGGTDRTYPLYHTAYHALIKGNGTCEAFAQAFTRLSREFGVASKVIMGVDSSAHTYNIVDVGSDQWMFIDCSAGVYLKGSNEFSRAKEQEQYTSTKYALNYWNKVVGGTNYNAKYLKVTHNGTPEYFASINEAHTYIIDSLKSEIAAGINDDSPYILELQSDWKIDKENEQADTLMFDEVGNLSSRIHVNLNGHTLTFSNTLPNNITLGKLYNGTINIGTTNKSGNLELSQKIEVSNVKFVGTGISGADYVLISANSILLDKVSFKGLKVSVQAGYGSIDSYIYDFVINDDVVFDACTFYMTGMADPYTDTERTASPVIISKKYDDSSNEVYSGKLVFKNGTSFGMKGYASWNEDNWESKEESNYSYVQRTIVFKASGNGDFKDGDVLIQSSGTLRIINSTGTYVNTTIGAIVDANSVSAQDKVLQEKNGAVIVSEPRVVVSVYNKLNSEEYASQKYVSLEDGLAGIATLSKEFSSSSSLHVGISFVGESQLSSDVSIPSNVKSLSLGGYSYPSMENGNTIINRYGIFDLNGHKLTISKNVECTLVHDNLKLVSTASNAGTISAVNTVQWEVDTKKTFVDAGGDSVCDADTSNLTLIDKVNISSQSAIVFQTDKQNGENHKTYSINGSINCPGNNGSLMLYGNNVEYVFEKASTVDVGFLGLNTDAQFDNLNVRSYLDANLYPVQKEQLYNGAETTEEEYEKYLNDWKGQYAANPSLTITGKTTLQNVSRSMSRKGLEIKPEANKYIVFNLVSSDNGVLPDLTINGNVYGYISDTDNSSSEQINEVILIKKVNLSGTAINFNMNEKLATVKTATAGAFVLDEAGCAGKNMHVEKEGTSLLAAGDAVNVICDITYYDENNNMHSITYEHIYSSISKGINAIGGADFYQYNGEYKIELLADSTLNTNITVPVKATGLTITTPRNEGVYEMHTLDMQGHTLTSAGAYTFRLGGGATLTNTSATRAAVNFTNKYSYFEVDASSLPDQTTVINGVNISTSKATNISESMFTADAGKNYTVSNSTITANMVSFYGGNWTTDTFNVNSFNMGTCRGVWNESAQKMVYSEYKEATLQANAVTASSYVGVHNTATINTLTLNGAYLQVMNCPEAIGNTPKLNVTTLNVQRRSTNRYNDIMVDEGYSLSAKTLNLGANRLTSFGTLDVDTFNSSKGAVVELYPTSVTSMNNKGTIYGLYAYGTPTLNRKASTVLAINGSIKRGDDTSELDIHTVDNSGDLVESTGVLFTTDIKSFPMDTISLTQPDGSEFTSLIQIGNNVMVAGEFITVGTIQADNGKEIALKTFAKWSDAIGYVNEIANATTDYYIEISHDVTTMEAFSVPAKAKSVTIRGAADANPTITCLGNLAPAADVVFKDIKVNFTTYDAATKTYVTNDKAIINFKGRKITLDNAYFLNKFSAANGAKNSTLVLKKGNMADVEATLTVTGALTTGGLTVDGYTITASNVTSQTEATLKSATITSAGNITFANVTSLDANNKLTTGAGKANKLTISGTYSDNAGGNTTVTIKGADGNGTATAVVNTNAISISSRYIETEIEKAVANGAEKSYADYSGQVIATASKLPTTALVIGKQGNTVSFLTKKNGNNLVVDSATETAVVLYEIVGGANQVRGNFVTLQDALTEIDRYANKNASYEVQMVSAKSTAVDANGNGKVTSYLKDLSMPRQLAALTITSMDDSTATILTKGTLTLNSALTLKNVKVEPKTTLNVNLGNYQLSLEDAYLATEEGKSLVNVTGANTTGASGLAVKNATAKDMTLNGNLKVSKLSLNGVNITVHGTTSVGEIKQEGIASSIRGTAKVATKKVNGELQIADVTPNVTIDRTITSEPNEFFINLDVVRTENREKYYNDLLSVLEDYKNYDEFRESTGIKFAKALKADASAVSFTEITGENGSVVKRGGFLVYTSLDTVPFTLTTATDTVPCFSFADAVTEINNRNDKNADYTITANESDGYYEEHPETFAMPATVRLHSLTIQAPNQGHKVLYYGSKNAKGVVSAIGKIILTTDTTVKNITFMDAEVASKLDADPTTVPNRAPLTLALGGKKAVFENVIFEGRALLIDGGRNGELTLTGDDCFKAVSDIDADYLAEYPTENIIEGNITNVKKLTLDDESALLLRNYVSNARGAVAKTTLSVTNFIGKKNNIQSQGNVSLVNVSTEGTEQEQTIIEADGTFTVSGNLNASSDNNLVLIGRQKNDRNKTPQLNVTGTVADKKVLVALLPYDVTDQDANTALVPSETAGLAVVTSAKNGVEKFSVAKTVEMDQAEEVLYTGATAATFDPTAAAASRGTALVKTGNLLYAYDASNIHVGVKIVDESAIATRLTNLNNKNMMGYYLTFADAVNAINAKNNRNNCYDIVLLDDINVASVALPAANRAKAVSVQGYGSAKKLTVSKAVAIPVSTTLIAMTVEAPSVSQTAKTTLTMNGNSVLYGTNGAVSLQNIATDGTAKINYTRNNRSQSQLTIAGDVTNTTGKLTLCMAKDYKNANAVVGNSASYMANDKAEINANKLLFTGAKVKSGDVEIKIGDDALTTTVSAGANAVVKNANGFYFVNSSFLTEAVGLADGDVAPHTYYLDLNQATNQIKVNADKKDYTVYLGVASAGTTASTILDANVTDRNAHSAIVLPTNNTVGALTIKDNNSSRTAELYYSGSLTGYVGAGKALTFENVELVPVAANDKNGAVQPVTNSNITVNRNSADRTGEVGLVLYNVSVSNGNGGVGYLNAIVGQKNATNVETNKPLTLVTGFTNVNTLTINGANEVVAGGRSSINTLDFGNANAGFVAIGATTVGTIRTVTNASEKKAYGYIAGNGRGFTLSGGVTGENTVVPVKVLKAGAKYNNFDVIAPADSSNIDLLTAPKADPARFTLTGEATELAYKFGNTVRVDKKENLKIKVTGDELSAYAHDYPEAIAAINTWGDKTKDYTITFLDTAGDVVTTNATKNIAVPTNITYPRANAAKSLTITSETDAKTLRYTANLSPVVATTFDKVKLDNGTYNGRTREFTSNHNVNIAATGAALTFTENAKTVSDDNGNASATFDVNTINSTKGLTLNGQTVKANGTVNITTLNVNGDVAIRSNNGKTITLTNVVGSAGADHLTLDAPISGSATALNTPQLKINGTVIGVEDLLLDPLKAIYNGRTLTGWEYMTEADLDARKVVGGENAAALKNKVLSNGMQKVPTNIITVNKNTSGVQGTYASGANELYKSGANLYLLSDPSLLKVKVTATGYEAKFLTWADAVNDINARRDNTVDYTIALLDTIGGEETATNVSIAFPAANAAKSVTVTEEGGQRQLYFTNGSLSVGTNVTIDGVELIPVKNFVQYGQRGFWVNPSGYGISVSGNNTLTFKDCPDPTPDANGKKKVDAYFNISTVSGGKLVLDDNAIVVAMKNVTVKDLTLKKAACLNITGGNLIVQNSLTMTEQSTQQGENISKLWIEGNATLKNPTIAGGSVFANNITTQGTATLSNDAALIAVLNKNKGQGRITMQNLVIGENGCSLYGKQDANGNSMMNITGTVTRKEGLAVPAAATVRVGMLYNNCDFNSERYVSLMDGIKLLTAAKIAQEAISYFVPLSETQAGEGDGHVLTDGYTTYKLPRNNFMFYGVKPANAL